MNTVFGGDGPSDANAWQLQPDDVRSVIDSSLCPTSAAEQSEIRPVSRPYVKLGRGLPVRFGISDLFRRQEKFDSLRVPGQGW